QNSRHAPPGGKKSDLLDLTEIELDRRGATKNGDGHADLAFFVVDFLDAAVEVGKGAFLDAYGLADLEEDLGTGLFDAFFHLRKDLLDFAIGNGRRTVAGTPQETGDTVGAFDQVPGFVGKIHFDQHVAGKDTAFRNGLAAVLDFDDLFGGHEYAAESVLQPG